MQTHLAAEYQGLAEAQEAESILRQCVHCGFCSATCPTYQELGDELDGPRGRIYLIKQVLEGQTPTRATQQHLDRCLGCRNCETTCPSGVAYGELLEIGRELVDAKVERPRMERLQRWALREGLSSSWFAPALRTGQALRRWLPERLAQQVPARSSAGRWPSRTRTRQVLLLAGCVQPALQPNINAATARVLDAAGIQTRVIAQAGCCGAVKAHLNDLAGGRAQMRANIDAWWPWLESGRVEAVISNASGCSAMLKGYGHALRQDPVYAAKAARVSALAQDLSEWLPELAQALDGRVVPPTQPLLYHPPCSLQHAQKLVAGVETYLGRLGFSLSLAGNEAHLCCGSAGTYSVLQPAMAKALRDRKLAALERALPQAQGPAVALISANIGCIRHLQSGTPLPVKHWVEVLDQALPSAV